MDPDKFMKDIRYEGRRRVEFLLDEHVLRRCDDYSSLDIWDVLDRLKGNSIEEVRLNDSKQGWLKSYKSYKVFINVSTNYQYVVIIYITPHKPLIKTVYKNDRNIKSRISK